MVYPVQVRPISNDEGNRLVRIVRRVAGSVVIWRRAQMVLLSARHMPVAKIAEVKFTSPDWVRDVLHNFNTDGLDSLYPRYAGGRPPKFDLRQRAKIKQVALIPARPITTCGYRPGACPSWPTSWSPRGRSTTSHTRVCACCCVRRTLAFKR